MAQTFQFVVEFLDRAMGQGASNPGGSGITAIIDLNDSQVWSFADLDPIGDLDWAAVVALLILAFPEIHWMFETPPEMAKGLPSDLASQELAAAHILEIHAPSGDTPPPLIWRHQGFQPLFDPTGLRQLLRKSLATREKPPAFVPIRRAVAGAVDEEEAYASFNGYAAFRSGHRVWMVTSEQLLLRLLGKDSREQIHLLFEDIYLNLPDQQHKLSNLQNRDRILVYPNYDAGMLEGLDELDKAVKKHWRQLCLQQRFFITVGHHQNPEYWEKNQEYVAQLDNRLECTKILIKPFAGFFDLCRKIGLLDRHGRWLFPPFEWPPSREFVEQTDSHSAPGRLLMVAQMLLRRAKAVLKSANSVPDAIYAATLALEAKELLGHQTPTTSLEALAVQHQAEVMAGSMFHGVEYNLKVGNRFQEIATEVESISRYFNQESRQRSELNARLAITEILAKKFCEFNQFEEENACLTEARRLRFAHWVNEKPGRWIFKPFLDYLNFTLQSLSSFFLAVAMWILLFTFIYYAGAALKNKPTDIIEAFSAAACFFFTLSPSEGWNSLKKDETIWWWNLILTFQGVISFTNLSLFITHIYRLLSRK